MPLRALLRLLSALRWILRCMRWLRHLASAVAVLALYASFSGNAFGLWNHEDFLHFQGDSEQIVLNKLESARTEGLFVHGGFMMGGDGWYYSQSGLQGMVFASLSKVMRADDGGRTLSPETTLWFAGSGERRVTHVEPSPDWLNVYVDGPLDPSRDGFPNLIGAQNTLAASTLASVGYAAADITDGNWANGVHRERPAFAIPNRTPFDPAPSFRHFLAFAFALLLTAFALRIGREHGLLAAAAVFFGVLFSSWITLFARNLYWVIALQYAPFVVFWLCYERALPLAGRDPARVRTARRILFPSLLLLVLFKSLSGYEYVTNVVSSAAVPVVYYGIKHRVPYRVLLRDIAWVACWGTAGFALAVGVHALQGALVPGGIGVVLERLASRMDRHSHLGADLGVLGTLRETRDVILSYMPMPTLVVPFIEWTVSIGAVVRASLLVTLIVVLAKAWNNPLASLIRSRRFDTLDAMAAATLMAILSSFSWAALARGHMAPHHHMNGIVFSLPFTVMAFALFGASARRALGFCAGRAMMSVRTVISAATSFSRPDPAV